MNSKDLKIAINSIRLPEESKERIIQSLEHISPDETEQMDTDEYVFIEPEKTSVQRHTAAVISVCAVLAFVFAGIYVYDKGGVFSPASDIPQQKVESVTPDMFSDFLTEYNQEHGTQLRFPTEDEYTQAGTTESECFAFFAEFPDKASFLQYVDVLVSKGETIISNFHRTNLYDNAGNGTEVIGYHYFFYNASGQTYGSSGVEGLKYGDEPDLIACAGDNGLSGYILKTDE